MDTLFLDSRERKTPAFILEAFPDAVIRALAVGDLWVNDGVIIEFKVDADVHDYARLADELTRLNSPPYNGRERHLIYVEAEPLVAFKEYKIAVSMAQKAGVWAHHVPTLPKAVEKVKQIIRGGYTRPLQAHAGASRDADPLVRMIAEIPGVSEAKALELRPYIRAYLQEAAEAIPDAALRRLLDPVLVLMGINKDGEPSLPACRVRDFLLTGGDSA